MAKSNKEIKLSSVRECRHCGNKSRMQILGKIEDFETNYHDDYPIEEGKGYELFKCASCENVELQSFDYCDAVEEMYFSYKTLYPMAQTMPAGLPEKVKSEYLASLKQKNISPNSYGVSMGRVLESACKDKRAKGRMLGQQIADLVKRGLIPPQLETVAFSVNKFRIVGAHAGMGDLTAAQVPIVENLTRAVLEYLYSAPYFLAEAKKSLRGLRKRKKRSPQKK